MTEIFNIPSFHFMAKPVGAKCNLNCEYCYFLEKKNLYKGSNFRMSDEVLEEYICQYMSAQQIPFVTISWQGGEPTLIGIDFYKKSIEFVEKYKKPNIQIEYTLQTNGTNMTQEWCDFFIENDFLVGVSIDGTKMMHDKFRKDKQGKSVFDKIIKNITLMQKNNVKFNVLVTVNSFNVKKPLKIYRFLRDELNIQFMHFIPIVEPNQNNGESIVSRCSISGETYGKFMIEIFDEWIKRDVGTVFVDLFDMILAKHYGEPHGACVFAPTCGTALVLEHTGDVYSCDHFVNKENFLGNIAKEQLLELVNSKQQIKFANAKEKMLPKKCINCDVLFICNGGCPKDRIIKNNKEKYKLNYLCDGYSMIFHHTSKPMKKMVKLLLEGKPPREIMNKN